MAPDLGKKSGVLIPLHAAEHFYIVTETIVELARATPTLRDMDAFSYFKEDASELLVGMFEHNAKPWGMDGIPESFFSDELPEDLDHLAPHLEVAMHRVPIMEQTGLQVFFNGPEAFTPDDRYHIGESPECRNYFVAVGFNSEGIQSAGGAGKVLTESIHKGQPPQDLWDINIRRNIVFQSKQRYLYDRTKESLGLLFETHYPFKQVSFAGSVRRSVLHEQLKFMGAVFGVDNGWERDNWFANDGQAPESD
ncbi:MAG: glycine/D-amino acid oxidase-like deaminating enzyme [Marinomonas primoryensis]